MSTLHNGYWVILETRQGGGLPDTVYGPYWNADDAAGSLDTFRAEAAAVGRRDRFQVGIVEIREES